MERAASCARCARRGRRCPVGAHAVAVAAARRLHCDARSAVASPNSLRSLRSLRSNNGDESVDEARCARRPQPCASRRHRNRPHRAPPAALNQCGSSADHTRRHCKGACGQAAARLLERREAQDSWPRAQRASLSDSSPLSERRERSERSERSEFGDGAMKASIAGQPPRSGGRSSEALRPARKRLCRLIFCARWSH